MSQLYNYYNVYSTYAVSDLSKVDKLETALNEFFKDLNVSNDYNQIARTRSLMKQYGTDDPSFDSIDIYNFVNELSYLSPNKAKTVLDCLDETIVYNKATDNRSRGLSIYFPYNGAPEIKKGILTKYYDFDNLKDYKDFIVSFNKLQNSNTKSLSFANNSFDINHNDSNKESDFQLQLNDEQIEVFSKARYLVFEKEKKNEYLPIYGSDDIYLDGKTLKANIKDRQLKVVDLSNNSEQIVSLNEESNDDKYITYSTFALLSNNDVNYSGEDLIIDDAKIFLILDKETKKISIDKVLIKSHSSFDKEVGGGYTIAANLGDYKYISFSITPRNILDNKGQYTDAWVDKTPTIFQLEPSNLSFELVNYNNNKQYYAVFKIWDIYGNVSYSKLVEIK